MNNAAAAPSGAWIAFTYASALCAAIAVIGGVLMLPLDMWMRAYLIMGTVMLVQSTVTLTKLQRDVHESSRLHNRIEEARTEKLLNGER